jgi:hypothetical protein
VDYTLPVEPVREELQNILKDSLRPEQPPST